MSLSEIAVGDGNHGDLVCTGRGTMKHRVIVQTIAALSVCVGIGICTLYVTRSAAQSQPQTRDDASPIYGITIPAGFRDWRLIAVNQLVGTGGKPRQLRAQLGNDVAVKAFHEGKVPYPDGAIIAALHWNEVPSEENDKVLAVGFPGAGLQSTVIGSAENVQFMVKESKKYAATGGWGFGDFRGGKPGSQALHETCFPCHQPVKDRDYVFARYAPAP
jgi:hypothetical protein